MGVRKKSSLEENSLRPCGKVPQLLIRASKVILT